MTNDTKHTPALPLRLKGHRLTMARSGAQSGYWKGSCECGQWDYTGWTDRQKPIRNGHQNHLRGVLNKLRADNFPSAEDKLADLSRRHAEAVRALEELADVVEAHLRGDDPAVPTRYRGATEGMVAGKVYNARAVLSGNPLPADPVREEMERNACRYLYLRGVGQSEWNEYSTKNYGSLALDAAIDAAIAKANGGAA